MYRALAAAALRAGVAGTDDRALLEPLGLEVQCARRSPRELEVEGYDAEDLTSIEVESTVSKVASHAMVRAHMRREQRELGEQHAVMEGRDIASVVFADAPVKLYLRARPDLRAERRAAERVGDVERVRRRSASGIVATPPRRPTSRHRARR